MIEYNKWEQIAAVVDFSYGFLQGFFGNQPRSSIFSADCDILRDFDVSHAPVGTDLLRFFAHGLQDCFVNQAVF
jgi:hypothetical protein